MGTGACHKAEGPRGFVLEEIAFQGSKIVIEQLLAHGIDKDIIDIHRTNALYFATRGKHLETVGYLLIFSTDVVAKDKRGFTTLHYVAAGGSFEILQHVLERTHFD